MDARKVQPLCGKRRTCPCHCDCVGVGGAVALDIELESGFLSCLLKRLHCRWWSTVIVKIESGSCLVRASFHLLYIKCSCPRLHSFSTATLQSLPAVCVRECVS